MAAPVVAGRPGCTNVVAGRTGSRPELYGVIVTVCQQSANSFSATKQAAALAEEQGGQGATERGESNIVLRVRREALWRNVFITRGYTGTP